MSFEQIDFNRWIEMTGKSLKFMRILSTQNIYLWIFQYDETETQNKDREPYLKRYYALEYARSCH